MAQNAGIIQKAAQKTAVASASSGTTLKSYLNQMEGEIKKALPSMISAERFTRICMSALSSNKALQNVDPASFLGAVMPSAQLGLEPNTPLGTAYIIPYGGKATFQLGYKGLLTLAYRSEAISTIQSQIVYENDTFEFSFGLDSKLNHVPARTGRGEPIYVYAYYQTKDGGYGYDVMSIEDVRNHAKKFSKAFGSGPWQSDFESMAKKTVLKRLLKYAPLSVEAASAVNSDETIRTHIADDMSLVDTEYVSEIPDTESAQDQSPATEG